MLRIKQIGTICFAISILISAPLFATDIPSNAVTADCKHTPLQVYSGTSNLQAGWQANTIQLHWYNGDTEIQNVPVTSQSCTYDSTLTPPSTIPTRIGYTFRGWRAYDPMRGLQNVYIGAASNVYADKPLNGGADETAGGATAATYGLTNPGEWGVSYNYGDVTGVAKCSALAGDNNNSTWTNANSNWTATESELDSASGEKQYCWCKATGYTPGGGIKVDITSSNWIYSEDFGAKCAAVCSSVCANDLSGSGNYKKAFFYTY